MALHLDLEDLSNSPPSVLDECMALQSELSCHIAAYRRDATRRPHGLCSMFRAARVSRAQEGRLAASERRFPDHLFVAYAKPLAYRCRVRLGESSIPRIGLGTMRLVGSGAWGPAVEPKRSVEVLQRAVAYGLRLLDTADAYGPGYGELLIAEALYPYPDDLVLATKGGIDRQGSSRWIPNGRPEYLRRACEASLIRLRVDAIPLYQLHCVDPLVPIEESLGALSDLRTQGKIRNIGLCNVSPREIERATRVVPISSVQNRYNLADQTHKEVLSSCETRGIPLIAWAPLGSGRLASRGSGTESEAKEALWWILRQSPLTVAIPGATTLDELLESIAALSCDLSVWPFKSEC